MQLPSTGSSISRLTSLRQPACAILFVSILTGCHQAPAITVPKTLQLDNRTWSRVQLAEPRAGADYTLEYLPPGQTKTDWTELVTEQFFANAQQSTSSPSKERPLTAVGFALAYLNRLSGIQNSEGNKNGGTENNVQRFFEAARTSLASIQNSIRKLTGTVAAGNQDTRTSISFKRVLSSDPHQSTLVWEGMVQDLVAAKTGTTATSAANEEIGVVNIVEAQDGLHVHQYTRRVPEPTKQNKTPSSSPPSPPNAGKTPGTPNESTARPAQQPKLLLSQEQIDYWVEQLKSLAQ